MCATTADMNVSGRTIVNTLIRENATRAEADALARDSDNPLLAAARSRGLPESGMLLVIDVASQSAALHSKHGLAAEYKISTSKFGTGNKAGSNQTPLGWHKVTERFGADKPAGTSFVSRKPDGEILPPSEWRSDKAKDYILSRVLWLSGLEPGVNSGPKIDSHERCIYLHGTNQEHLLGKPASHGCIRFANADIIEIFAIAKDREIYCLILQSAQTLETKRLILRGLEPEDFNDFRELASEKIPTDENEIRKIFKQNLADNANSRYIWHRAEKKIIGFVRMKGQDENGNMDMEYKIHSDYQNNDIDREALAPFIESVFNTTDAKAIITDNDPDKKRNTPLYGLGFKNRNTNAGQLILERNRHKGK